MTNEEILEKLNHKDGLIKTVEIHKAMEAARKDEADRLRENCSANHVNIDDLLTAFNNAGFDTSNWDGEEGAEQALVDGVKNEIDRLRGEVERLKDLINTVAGDFFAAGLRRAKSKNPETLNLVDYKEYYFKQNNIQ